ncbi:hypothetical protein [Corallococcus aberystwythensis]|uniref:Uncharacterized protein n=1 Tax=Corallococcus aberystwythensis TaxID=2316722 RepID=A0A3A8PJ20_9BACT|nr:hypothetical protein [Corallococcus aberystwythensis]RKH54631.1 hypothetical protein D7W81_38015 [Corallococcus aberystwythensis]
MEFRKTTVLPLEDAKEAQRLLRTLINDEPYVLFVVLGEGPHREQLVSKAGKFAGLESDLKWVVWARSLEQVRPELEKLKGDAQLKNRVLTANPQAFVLSFADELRDVIEQDEPIDNVRVVRAYLNGQKLS